MADLLKIVKGVVALILTGFGLGLAWGSFQVGVEVMRQLLR